MKETLYSIPVNDAFNSDCECPICRMYKTLEDDSVDYTMGPSYMEDDTRALTDAQGFCKHHIRMVYNKDNRLGMAWVMKTRFDKVIKDLKKDLPEGNAKALKKGIENHSAIKYIDKLNNTCFVCNRIDNFFDRYVDTVLFLWKSDSNFKELYKNSKGFCIEHYGVLIKAAAKHLKGDDLEEFVKITNDLFITNMERVRDDVAWFINKNDYNYHDEPWYNAKDSVKRSLIKESGYIHEEK
ncbi:MAG: DUF6062 family protein [Butyrivibrio sp.]|nr:DUF6062 family protein [Butyrivibrio sp.]